MRRPPVRGDMLSVRPVTPGWEDDTKIGPPLKSSEADSWQLFCPEADKWISRETLENKADRQILVSDIAWGLGILMKLETPRLNYDCQHHHYA